MTYRVSLYECINPERSEVCKQYGSTGRRKSKASNLARNTYLIADILYSAVSKQACCTKSIKDAIPRTDHCPRSQFIKRLSTNRSITHLDLSIRPPTKLLGHPLPCQHSQSSKRKDANEDPENAKVQFIRQ